MNDVPSVLERAWRAVRQPTVRLRLTAIYAAIFAFCGIALVVTTFLLTANAGVLFPGIGPAMAGQSGISIVTQVPPGGFVTPGTGAISDGTISSSQLQAAIANKQAETLRQLAVAGGISLALMLAFALVLSWLAAGRVLMPISSITRTARRLSQNNLQERIALEGPRDELRDLADTIDAMLDRLASAFEAQRRFVANASHELRTPLTRGRALVDVTLADPEASVSSLRAMGERVRAAVDEQERLIDGLLTLARGERGIDRRDNVDLAAVAARALDAIKGMPGQARGLDVHSDLQPAPVHGDLELIERAAFNLLDNAVAHNVDGGSVEVRTSSDNGHSFLRVANTGQVIPKETIPVLFEAFRRQGPDRAGRRRGHGLGLSIVASVVAAHGGTLDARPHPNGGLDITIRLPAA